MKKLMAVCTIVPLMTCIGVADSRADEPPAPRGEIRVVDKNPFNWISITFNVFEHLMELDRHGNMVPRLATGWRWLDDRTIEFKLRQGVKFHNGEVFDAEIMELNWNELSRLQQPHSLGGHYNFDEGAWMETVDPYTVRFHFPRPDGAAYPKFAALHIANRQFYREVSWGGERHWCEVQRAGPWGTGPYELVEGHSNPNGRTDVMVFEAHADYWDAARAPRLERIVFLNALSQDEAIDMVKSDEGRIDLVTDVSPLKTLDVAQSPHANVVKNRESFTMMFGLINMLRRDSRWTDRRLRRAVNLALDREAIIRYAAKGNGRVIPGLIADGLYGFDPGLPPYPFDPARARRLIAEAGYPDGFTLELLATPDLDVLVTVIGNMLEEVGIDVRHRIVSAEEFGALTIPGLIEQPGDQTWDIALMSYYENVNFPTFIIHKEVVLDGGTWTWLDELPELRALYERILRVVDQEEQEALVRQMEKQIRDEAYFLFLYSPIKLYAVNKEVEFVTYATTDLIFAETKVTDEHWSVRQGGSD